MSSNVEEGGRSFVQHQATATCCCRDQFSSDTIYLGTVAARFQFNGPVLQDSTPPPHRSPTPPQSPHLTLDANHSPGCYLYF